MTTTEIESKTTDSSQVNVNRVAISATVEVVAVELSATFQEEVNILAKTETELQTGRYWESPSAVLNTIVAIDV